MDLGSDEKGGGGGKDSGSASGARGSTRWNPTKEQVDLLESLYKQGVRTPTTEQIQQITSMLRAFGHIEGKNVFYWFQNHKARQRQKQKQESIAYFNRLLHKTTQFLYNPPCSNVTCCLYNQQRGDSGTFDQRPKMTDAAYGSRGSTAINDQMRQATLDDGLLYKPPQHISNINLDGVEGGERTLSLFPLLPTSANTAREDMEPYGSHPKSADVPCSTAPSCFADVESDSPPFIDFFNGS